MNVNQKREIITDVFRELISGYKSDDFLNLDIGTFIPMLRNSLNDKIGEPVLSQGGYYISDLEDQVFIYIQLKFYDEEFNFLYEAMIPLYQKHKCIKGESRNLNLKKLRDIIQEL